MNLFYYSLDSTLTVIKSFLSFYDLCITQSNHFLFLQNIPQVDELIDQDIQINSNKHMRNQYLNAWTLRFKVESQEKSFCQLREDMFRSNMLCVFAMWIFIALCQAVIIPRCTVQTISLGVTTFILICLFVLVMAEEYHCKF